MAEQDVPPGIRERVVRIRVAQTGIRPVVQIAEPEPRERTPRNMHHATLSFAACLPHLGEDPSPLRGFTPMRLRRDGGKKGGAGGATWKTRASRPQTRSADRHATSRTDGRTRAIPAARWT